MASSLKEYLKKYQSSDEVEKKNKKKKKKNQKKPDVTGVLVVDEDPVWQKPIVPEEENDDDSADEEKPQVDEDIEVKRMKRLEQLKARRPYGLISDDGSGWVSVNNAPQKLIDSNSDMSPPRKRRSRNDTPSPEPELKPSDAEIVDLSPPRQRRRRYHSPSDSEDEKVDLSHPRKQRASLNTGSPERTRITSKSGHEDLDMSPPRRRSHVPDLSPPRRGHHDSPSRVDSRLSPKEDLSPPRKSRSGNLQSQVQDLSPPRKSRRDLSLPRKQSKESTSRAEQRKTGLVSGKDVTEEVQKAKKEEFLRFKAKDPSITGKGAEPIYRDKKTGQRLTKDEFLKSQKKEEKPKEVKLEWGKGLAQKREAEARQEELELEKAKPFARTRDDPDLDRMMKNRLRWGDPMAPVKKKHDELVLPDMGDDEKMKASGFIVPQEIPNHSWLKRGLEAAPNRYNIKPGRHWDGLDRSTGFEQAMFKRMNEKQATEKEAYLWSVADM